ncbi:flagellar hook assembly protein FlgD [Dyella subtropica]|uniref:flagellar hook assembly protein FlgD n=1 Tax=Dyella subtropica TaxID=2992127 RepID=UPI0022534793|nr:flagellar hook capping FlgD N-terminal domain-containing protein [Dyella subtropica]
MSTIPSTNNTSNSSSGTGSSVNSAMSKSMSQADFLKLMTTQLQAQDPTHPVDNSQFASQMAQFSQLSATQDLLTSINALSTSVNNAMQTSQVLNSSNLINRSVMVPSTSVGYSGTALTGAANVVSAGAVTVQVKDASGNVVRTLPLGNQGAGLAQFTWDGKDDNGNTVATGNYTLSASSGGAKLDTYVSGKVTGVGYGGGSLGTYLQVAGVGGVALSQVAQIL